MAGAEKLAESQNSMFQVAANLDEVTEAKLRGAEQVWRAQGAVSAAEFDLAQIASDASHNEAARKHHLSSVVTVYLRNEGADLAADLSDQSDAETRRLEAWRYPLIKSNLKAVLDMHRLIAGTVAGHHGFDGIAEDYYHQAGHSLRRRLYDGD